MAGTSVKRNLELSTPSPTARQSKKVDNKSTPKSRLQPPQASVKPLYPSNQDKHNLVNVVDHFTKLALEPDLDRIPKGAEHSEGEGLVLKIELRKIELVNGLDSLITSLLMSELGKNDAYDFNACVAEAEQFTSTKLLEILDLDDVDPAKQLVAKMANHVSNRLLAELMSSNMVPSANDTSTVVNEKKTLLRLTNPFRPMITIIVDDMLVQGVANMPSIVRNAGLMASLSENYHSILNSMAESEKRLDLMTNQIGTLTQTVTDQENSESHRMLVIRGIADVILTKETPGAHVRAAREVEAVTYRFQRLLHRQHASIQEQRLGHRHPDNRL